MVFLKKPKKCPKTVKNKLQLRNVLEPAQTKEIKRQKIGNNSDNSDFQIVSKKAKFNFLDISLIEF